MNKATTSISEGVIFKRIHGCFGLTAAVGFQKTPFPTVNIVHKGTSTIGEMFLDSLFFPSRFETHRVRSSNTNVVTFANPGHVAFVHYGFGIAHRDLNARIMERLEASYDTIAENERKKVVFEVTGHSLGASLAYMLAIELAEKYETENKIPLTTYALPGYRFTDDDFAQRMEWEHRNLLHYSYASAWDPAVLAGKVLFEQPEYTKFKAQPFHPRWLLHEYHKIAYLEQRLKHIDQPSEWDLSSSRNRFPLPLLRLVFGIAFAGTGVAVLYLFRKHFRL
jgi:hypothetical protein